MILTIDGVAGAGKTTLADYLQNEYRHRCSVQVIHMDDLYGGWVDPLGADLSGRLREIVQAHREQGGLDISHYDWRSSRFAPAVHFDPVDLLIIEGVGCGQRVIREFVDTKIWIDLEPIVGLRRVLARDGYQIEQEMLNFMEAQREHFLQEGTRDSADYHLNGLN